MPVVAESGDVLGMVTMGNLTSFIVQGRAKSSDPISKVLYRQFKEIDPKTPLSTISRIFDTDHFALVVTTQKCYAGSKRSLSGEGQKVIEKKMVFGVVTRIDLLNYIISHQSTSTESA